MSDTFQLSETYKTEDLLDDLLAHIDMINEILEDDDLPKEDIVDHQSEIIVTYEEIIRLFQKYLEDNKLKLQNS